MRFEIERGCFGYIKKKKKRQIFLILLFMVIAVVMFVTGLLLNKFNRANMCTVLSILMVLPMTKMLVTYIVLFPYKTVPKETYDKVNDAAGENAVVMADMVITSPDKPMNLDFVIITDNQVIGMLGRKKQDIAYIENFLKESLKTNKIEGFTVKIFDDYKPFLNCITREYEKTEKQEECFKYIRTLVV